jgi:branched-chain amino acid transport system substrate-binding protein
MLSTANFRKSAPCLRLCHFALVGIIIVLSLIGPSLADATAPIKIASIYSFSGPAADANKPSFAGVRLAVKEINSAGGVLGRQLELIEIDNLSTPIGSKVAADEAIKHHVTAIIGAAFSSHSMAIAKVAQKHHTPMITNISTNPAVTHIGDYIFRAGFNDSFQGKVMARFAREELRARSVLVIFNVASDYSLGFTHTFENAFIQGGGDIVAKLSYKVQQPHLRDIVDKAKSMQPEAIFIAGHSESGLIAKEAIQRGIEAIMLGGDGWDSESFFSHGGNQIALGYYTTHWSQSIDTPISRQFVARYGGQGMLFAPTALAYDAVKLLADAIERAGTTRRSIVRDKLAQTKGFEGVTGTISFNSLGDPVKSVVLVKIEAGRPVYFKEVEPGEWD